MKKKVKILIIFFVNVSFLLAIVNDMSVRLCPLNNLCNCSKPYIPDVLKWEGFSNKNLLSANDKSTVADYGPLQYRIDVGFNNNVLLSSKTFKKGYSGFGFFVEPYITKHFSFKFEFDRWTMSSLREEPDITPFKQTTVWKKNYLLKINIYPWNQLIFTQFGFIETDRKVGYEKRGGISCGIGYRLINRNNINLCLIIKRNELGELGVILFLVEILVKNGEVPVVLNI